MRILTAFLFLAFSGLASAESSPIALEDFNRFPSWDGTSASLSTDPSLVAHFKGKKYVCSELKDTSPTESEAAARAFNEFVDYTKQGDKIENFWMDATHKKQRENLLSAAVKAGSWKADYLDSVWAIRYRKNAEFAQQATARLLKLVEKGVPIAAYKYATYLFGRDNESMYYLYSAAIDRGNPHAMTTVGTTIVVQSKALRPIGQALLECAASKGHANAYKGLGILANMEGRRLDAYRLWAKGTNEGCEECHVSMESIAKARDRTYGPLRSHHSMLERVPELIAIKQFQKDNMFYELTELADFERRIPKEMAFYPSDSELLQVLTLEEDFYLD